MGWDRELEDLMVDTVQVSTGVSSRTAHGVETWSTPKTVTARVVRGYGVRRNDRGETFPEESIVWFRSTFMLTTSAMVTVDGHAQPVSRTSVFKDDAGLYHHKLWLGWVHRGN